MEDRELKRDGSNCCQRYVFMFEWKVMKGMNYDDSFSDRDFKVARAFFEVTQAATGSLNWEPLGECDTSSESGSFR